MHAAGVDDLGEGVGQVGEVGGGLVQLGQALDAGAGADQHGTGIEHSVLAQQPHGLLLDPGPARSSQRRAADSGEEAFTVVARVSAGDVSWTTKGLGT
ncbi:hypothetical protein BS329_09765 [Amycolatopsis coloradensis]|uniref:Uncharacterized protein n=1 Tax=Amycolatopsis coloradensis TaxID=76021 RepID=A0A1R0KVP2_9PSEU|nr:hypothetical protein BS329_09765 [Amycolatopsis coloradensis]